MTQRTVPLTAAGKARLEEELENLKTRRIPDIDDRIQGEIQSGNLTDNPEFEDLKEQRAIVEARINELEQTLSRAVIISGGPGNGVVGLGSKVTIRTDDGEEETWIIVHHEEANTLEGTISTESPVGKALVGKREGESATVSTPGGSMMVTVLHVD